MSGTEPAEPAVPPVLLPGQVMDAFISSIAQLLPAGPVIIGGLAVMSRVGGEHRPTLDIDSAFNNDTDTTTCPTNRRTGCSSAPTATPMRPPPRSPSSATRTGSPSRPPPSTDSSL